MSLIYKYYNSYLDNCKYCHNLDRLNDAEYQVFGKGNKTLASTQ